MINNSYGYGGAHYGPAQPVVPPRRKRSLSNTRADYRRDDDAIYGFGNRMRRNFSTDHLPQNENYYLGGQSSSRVTPTKYGSSGGLLNPSRFTPQSVLYQSPLRLLNPYGKSNMVSYNPYGNINNVDPRVMARPAIDPHHSTQIQPSIASAMQRGREPAHYSSKEQLANQQSMFISRPQIHLRSPPPERPPPPKLDRINPRISLENLPRAVNSSGLYSPEIRMTSVDFESEFQMYDERLSRERSLTPTRVTPTGVGSAGSPKPYNVRRSTSPMPSMSPTSMCQGVGVGLSRSPSGNRINNRFGSSSRETSPLHSPSFGNARSTAFSFTAKTPDLSPMTRSSSSSYVSRSALIGNSDNRSGPSTFASSGLANATSTNSNRRQARDAHNDSSQTGTSGGYNAQMDRLQLPGQHMNDQLAFQQQQRATANHQHANHVNPNDTMFSETFTDHCDQYKSLTSRIMGKKTSGDDRQSGEFGDADFNYTEEELHNASMRALQTRKGSALPESSVDGQQYFDQMDRNSEFGRNSRAASPLTRRPSRPQSPQAQQFETMLNNQLANDAAANSRAIVRRNSSEMNRRGSLPSDYVAAHAVKLSPQWSREHVATLAHEARQKAKNPESSVKKTLAKIGNVATRQFVFVLVAGLNILLAYVFYNLLVMLPKD